MDAVVTEDGAIDKTYFIPEDDKELAGKVKLFEEFGKQLEEYFGTMSLSILKTLKLTFQSKANDRRVEEVLKERGVSGYTKEVSVGITEKEPYVEPIVSAEQEEKKPEYENIEDAFKTYYNDKDAFVRDCVKILPGKVELKDKPKTPKTPIFESVKPETKETPDEAHFSFNMDKFMNDIREMIAKEIDGKLRYILGSPETLSKISEYLKNEEKEKQYTPVSTPALDLVDYSTNDSSTGDKELSAQQQSKSVQPEKRKRGRPKGSKNKPKTILNNPLTFSKDE